MATATDGPFIETKELIGGRAARESERRRPGPAQRRFGRSSGASARRLPAIDGERRRSIA
jgi:hypothetical protein